MEHSITYKELKDMEGNEKTKMEGLVEQYTYLDDLSTSRDQRKKEYKQKELVRKEYETEFIKQEIAKLQTEAITFDTTNHGVYIHYKNIVLRVSANAYFKYEWVATIDGEKVRKTVVDASLQIDSGRYHGGWYSGSKETLEQYLEKKNEEYIRNKTVEDNEKKGMTSLCDLLNKDKTEHLPIYGGTRKIYETYERDSVFSDYVQIELTPHNDKVTFTAQIRLEVTPEEAKEFYDAMKAIVEKKGIPKRN